ncbi:MAG: class I SAM-dependent methyltransferase, partial [Chloroflexi bacterium]|nr:class I SAM-dependent methyltransferase [Chloroflexota bacterium]
EAFPNARVTLLDYSQPMLDWARKLLVQYGSRVAFVQADLSQSNALARASGPFDAAVSALALHNLQNAPRIREVYAEVFAALRSGGCFLNMDLINAPTLALQRRYWEIMLSRRKTEGSPGGQPRGSTHELARAPHRHDDHDEWPPFPAGLDDQLAWLREAGFATVDCFWKDLGIALVGGYK